MLGLPPEEGGFENDPVLGLVENLGPARAGARRARGLRRRPGRHDPVHRDERGRDRSLADHVRDGELPAAPRGLPPPPPALQDAVARADRLRRDRVDRGDPAGPDRLPRNDVRVRRDALVHDRPRVDHRAPRERPRRGDRVPRRGRTCGSRGVDWPLFAILGGFGTAPPGSSSSSRSRPRAGSGSAGSRSGSSATRSTARRVVHLPLRETVRAPALVLGPSLTVEYRTIVVPVMRTAESEEALVAAARLAGGARRAGSSILHVIEVPLDAAARRRAGRAGGGRRRAARRRAGARRELRRAVVTRLVRARSAGPAIVEEAARRNAELIILGAPRHKVARRQADLRPNGRLRSAERAVRGSRSWPARRAA